MAAVPPNPRNHAFGLQIDYAGYLAGADAIARVALPKAAQGTLNLAALKAQSRLTQHAKSVFDRPVRFTETAFVVKLAKRAEPAVLESDVHAKDFQAEYLYRQIVGGVRKTGSDRGSGPNDLFVYAVRPTKAGGITKPTFGRQRSLSNVDYGCLSVLMADTRTSKHLKTPQPKASLPSNGSQEVALNDATLSELRKHWYRGRLDPADLRDVGEAIYGATWRTEIAKDLVGFRPRGGGRASSGKLSHALLTKWLDPKNETGIPAWVASALLELPQVALTRRRREMAEQLLTFMARLEAAQRDWVRARVPRYTPIPPTLEFPPSEAMSIDDFFALDSPTPEQREAAYDDGWRAYQVAADESDDDAPGRPVGPYLGIEWERGWREANVDHQQRHADWVELSK